MNPKRIKGSNAGSAGWAELVKPNIFILLSEFAFLVIEAGSPIGRQPSFCEKIGATRWL